MPEVKDYDLERRVYRSYDKYKESSAFFASIVCGEGRNKRLEHYAAFSTLLFMYETLTLARLYNQNFKNKVVQTIETGLTPLFDELKFKLVHNLLG